MATGPSYRVAFRRRRQGKTDYQQRRGLVLSGLPRFIVRGSLRNMTAEIVKAEVGGDKVVAYAHSAELAKNYGWLGATGNIPSAYLTGLLCGFKALNQGVEQAVLDVGLHNPSKGSRIFGALKGVLDAGLKVPSDKAMLPDEKRISGLHVVEYAKLLSSNPEVYQKRFSAQISKGLKPEGLSAHFEQVKEKIVMSLKKSGPATERTQSESAVEKKEDEPEEEQ
ncbi:MAG TPA: 50S ribosomal protein L18 [Candidatus Bathyarchaeia archaeon]|nr:50S ribosomal protein L18 [Candidatus Bathyarchaeia archaeon]